MSDEQRQKEINAFAALVAGGAEASSGTFRRDAPPSPQKQQNNFSAIASQVEDSGTFARSSAPKSRSMFEESNLESALAALTGETALTGADAADSPPQLSMPSGANMPQLKKSDLPMYSEQVFVPRPLFFGPILPPRVLNEARECVADALGARGQDRKTSASSPPQLNQLPPEVRNLVNAIHIYGHGLSPFPGERDDDESGFGRGDSYVSFYSPVWGDMTRLDREQRALQAEMFEDKEDKEEKPESQQDESVAAVTESSTLTTTGTEAFSGWSSMGLDDSVSAPSLAHSSLDQVGDVSEASQSTYNKQKQHGKEFIRPDSISAEKQLFGKLARGDSSSQNLINSPIPAKAKTGPPQSPFSTDASTTTPKPTGDDMFLKWARGGSPTEVPSSGGISPESQEDQGKNLDRAVDNDMFLKWTKYETDAAESAAGVTSSSPQDVVAEGTVSASQPADESMGSKLTGGDEMFLNWVRAEPSVDVATDGLGVPRLCDRQISGASANTAEIDDATFLQLARGESSPVRSPIGGHGEHKALLRRTSSADRQNRPRTNTAESATSNASDNDLFLQWARGESPASAPRGPAKPGDGTEDDSRDLSEQDLFSQWARGERTKPDSNMNDSFVETSHKFNSVYNSNTFLPVADKDSDDDSVVGSELKKKVGINEHLDAALASLAEGAQNTASGDISTEDSQALLLQVPLSSPGGRPLSNLELTNGKFPLFGVDDLPLPAEADLGIYETKDEQLRSTELLRSQELIEKHVAPNIYGQIACPNPALDPDDTHTWNSRSLSYQRVARGPSTSADSAARLGVLPLPVSPAATKRVTMPQSSPKETSRRMLPVPMPASKKGPRTPAKARSVKGPVATANAAQRTRFGWWNVGGDQEQNLDEAPSAPKRPLQKQPLEHSALMLSVDSGLEPASQKLHERNLPLSHLHPGTTISQSLPFLSDRPPTYRYLQIDAQAVGFPPLGGEVEPLFCALAIYNVETVSTAGGDATLAPVPDMHRCGRVTETLNFDVVSDPDLESMCAGSLWPYARATDDGSSHQQSLGKRSEDEMTQGTRCGVFPLPSNLSVSNLYAILIVQKVLSAPNDVEPYLKQGKATAPKSAIDVGKYKARAAKASNRHGRFLMPFAFGVAPLLQVFGADIPVVASSRAVQIPLFRFSAGRGERQIIDHIMVMLYPRANHRASGINGPAAVTNGGTAMLVMRNFGYLGLHSVVNSRSSLARDRLVDFTGEIQLRRKGQEESQAASADVPYSVNGVGLSTNNLPSKNGVYVVPSWHQEYIAEPTLYGGRNVMVQNDMKDSENVIQDLGEANSLSRRQSTANKLRRSHLFAQELAPIPLAPTTRQSTAPSGLGQVRGRGAQQNDIESYFQTSFCNELLCHPRLLHNCSKGQIVVKVEVREMEWRQDQKSYFAHLPHHGPCVHNNRRGSFLVHYVFSSCAIRCRDPRFLDEVKVKLPLLLNSTKACDKAARRLSLLFTVYDVKLSSSKKWANRLALATGTKRGTRKTDACDSSVETRGGTSEDGGSACGLQFLACGFLPLTSESCLINNGLHDVKLGYSSIVPSRSFCESVGISATTLVVTERHEFGVGGPFVDDISAHADTDDFCADEHASVGSGFPTDASMNSITDSAAISEVTEQSKQSQKQHKPGQEQMTLQVRLVIHSTVHSQNATLAEFLRKEPAEPVVLDPTDETIVPLLEASRDEVRDRLVSIGCTSGSEKESLLASTIDLAKADLCPASDITDHLMRVIMQLWKAMVVGTGESDLSWANPASTPPLRVHSFATLLHVLAVATSHMAKNGASQLDGKGKWNLTLLGRIVALVFDESKLFGRLATELFDENLFSELKTDKASSASSANLKAKRRGHVRSNFDLSKELSQLDITLLDSGGARGQPDNIFGLNDESDFELKSRTLPHPGPTSGETRSSKEASDTEAAITESADRRDLSGNGGGKGNHEDSAERDPDFKTSSKGNVKIDSVADFRAALEAGSPEDLYTWQGESAKGAALSRSFDGISSGGRQYWTIGPISSLETIREDPDGDDGEASTPAKKRVEGRGNRRDPVSVESESMDAELILRHSEPSKPSKKMRVPKLKRSGSDATREEKPEDRKVGVTDNFFSDSLSKSDDFIEKAGTAFLEVIGKNFGHRVSRGKENTAGEDRNVGYARHRKTRSRCSIDWTLPGEEASAVAAFAEDLPTDKNQPDAEKHDDNMSALSREMQNSLRLPNFVDRIHSLMTANGALGRWFPYAYEVVIAQWVSVLHEQRAAGEKDASSSNSTTLNTNGCVAEAASRSYGVAVACAPILFEIIKQSLGYRISMFFQAKASRLKTKGKDCPPLIVLDGDLYGSMEQLIAMITDACIDSRNFDSWEFRQASIDVNNSIVRFLRDLFGFLHPKNVCRLILVYFSRFGIKEGKQWQDRDSNIGLRCAWERTKLQLNAVTAFIRFPDFVRVNSPQMSNWPKWLKNAHGDASRNYFAGILDHHRQYSLRGLSAGGLVQRSSVELPDMHPHWLAELVTDICLSGSEHAEQQIQQRAASLLLELFWSHSQESMSDGTSEPVASMYITFLEKMLYQCSYLSSFPPKSHMRKDLLSCVVFVIQCAPAGLLGALWTKLCVRSRGKGTNEQYGGMANDALGETSEWAQNDPPISSKSSVDLREEPDILDMFGILNLCLATFEYEGADEQFEDENNIGENLDKMYSWRREFLLAIDSKREDKHCKRKGNPINSSDAQSEDGYATSNSRKWQAHDGCIVIVNTGHQIVREMHTLLDSSPEGKALLNPARRDIKRPDSRQKAASASTSGWTLSDDTKKTSIYSFPDVVIFVRAATSLYLHTLTLRQSDIALVKTFNHSVEIVKIFGIKIFLESLGETLQHWMRVVSAHCGARRAAVRVHALEFLEFMLRLTWDSYGSFFRIRIPLLAVQTEVMERIVATAAARYYRDQRRRGAEISYFSNGMAEASLAPLWRTLDRLHHQSASQNAAYRGALMRLAEKLKKLYRAYIAAHAMAFLKKAQSPRFSRQNSEQNPPGSEALLQASRISIQRVINASAGYSKQFLGVHGNSLQRSTVAHYEAVEDAFLAAADVFSPTELPDHRVAWLRKLAEFHSSRGRLAEEATCNFHIHMTLKHAALLHGSLWSNTPFLPWTDNLSDGVHIGGEGPASDPDEYTSDFEFDDLSDVNYGRQIDTTDSFRRIFYRVANSIRDNSDGWESGASKKLFFGVTLASEFGTVVPWITLREMEAHMVEAAESAGDLFLSAGIVESSRFAWGLATQYYANKFNYGKLAHVYAQLARTVISRVPAIDPSQQHGSSDSIGRFYRVWFHGGAPDELIGAEFVYRTDSQVKLEQFGKELREVIRCIIPEKTPIHLVLDGKQEEKVPHNFSGLSRLGPVPLEPVRIKVTPLRAVIGKGTRIRGLPLWFNRYIGAAFTQQAEQVSPRNGRGSSTRPGLLASDSARADAPGHREHARSFSASVFSSTGSTAGAILSHGRRLNRSADNLDLHFGGAAEGELVGVDKFAFLQPINKALANRDWLKTQDFGEKTIRVTQLQVGQCFPACVSRQPVIHRIVYTQSPLEASVEIVCEWCAILFRTAIATNGMSLLGTNQDPGIGNDASKVVADCIHSSRVKEMGLSLLKKTTNVAEEDENGDMHQIFDHLTEDEIEKMQLKLARAIVVFVELLHLLIARNRDLLLNVIQERKRGSDVGSSAVPRSAPSARDTVGFGTSSHPETSDRRFTRKRGTSAGTESIASQEGIYRSEELSNFRFKSNDDRTKSKGQIDEQSHATAGSGSIGNVRADSAIAVQGELQRAFISLSKALYPMVSGIMGEGTPRWLKQCCQDNYFSAYTYRNTRIPIGEELCFHSGDMQSQNYTPKSREHSGIPLSVIPPVGGPDNATQESPVASVTSTSAVSKNSDIRARRLET